MKLYQIVDLLSRAIDKKDVLFNDKEQVNLDGKLQEMYEGFSDGRFKNDEDAARALFGKGPDYPYYFEVKAKFRDQLLKNLFHLNLKSGKSSHYYRLRADTELSLQQAKLLLGMGQKYNAIWLFKRILKVAESYHYTSIMKDCYKNLRNQMVYEANVKKYNEYQEKWLNCKEIENAEEEAEELINQIRVRSQKSVKELKGTMLFSKQALKIISDYKTNFNTPILISQYYSIANSYYFRTSQWEKQLDLATEIDEESKKYPDKFAAVRLQGNHISKLYALILLNRIEEGLAYVENVLGEYSDDSINYYIILEDYYLLHMRAGNYEQALKIVNDATENKYFELVPKISRERWDIYREYALFFCDEISNNDIALINYFPEYSKDKIGFNLQILILQIIILLRDNKFDMLLNHIEKLRIYEIRQISKSENRRAQYFLRLIRQLASQDLNYEKCKKQGNKYYNLLKKFPEKEQPYTEVEIIPYETLWKTILTMLKHPKRRNSEGRPVFIEKRLAERQLD